MPIEGQRIIYTQKTKASVAKGSTAVLDMVSEDLLSAWGWVTVIIKVNYETAGQLQAHLIYQNLTVTSLTAGGTTVLAFLYDGSSGNFKVVVGDFVVTRPANKTIRITYTNNNAAASTNDVVFIIINHHAMSSITIA